MRNCFFYKGRFIAKTYSLAPFYRLICGDDNALGSMHYMVNGKHLTFNKLAYAIMDLNDVTMSLRAYNSDEEKIVKIRMLIDYKNDIAIHY